jgi:hypothetical protein
MELIGVPINLSKSVVAKNSSFEFAKVTGHKGHNVSAISWKMFISQNTLMGRVNILYSLLNKGINPCCMGAWMRNIISKSFFNEGNATYSYIALLTMFAKAGKLSYKDLISLLVFKGKDGKVLKISYKNFMKGIEKSSLLSVLVGLQNNKSISFPNQSMTDMETNFFRNKV